MRAYIELTETDGSKIKLNKSGILLGVCQECAEVCAALTNQGIMRCTHCGGPVEWQWNTPQLSFLPEGDPSFMGWDRGKKKKAK